MTKRAVNPLDKEFYAILESCLLLVGHGSASLSRLVRRTHFQNGLENIYATAEDWGAQYIILADFDRTSTTSGILIALAHARLGNRCAVALLYMDGNYETGPDF